MISNYMTPHPKRLKVWWLTSLIVIAFSCQNRDSKPEKELLDDIFCLEEPFRSKVIKQSFEELPVTNNIHFTGSIHYAQNDLVLFRSLLNGSVNDVNFELGDYVQKGQVMATIVSNELNELEESRNNLKSRLSLENRQLEVTKSMAEDGLASSLEIKELQNSIQILTNSLTAIERSLTMYNSTDQQGVYQILAPNTGYVVHKNINPGANISAFSDAVFSISSLEKVWAMIDIHARDIPTVKREAPVQIKTTAYPELLFEGKINQISQVLDEEDRVLKARVELTNKEKLLKPGMNAEAWIENNSKDEIRIAIPNESIIYHERKQYCLVYKDDCNITINEITPYASNDIHTFIEEKFEPEELLVISHELLIFEHLKNR